jgi:heptosyltransferase-2
MGTGRATLHKTLVIRFSSVGDIILSSLLLRVFRKRFPGCEVDYIVKEEYGDLVRNNPNVTHVLEFPTGGTFADLHHLRRTIRATGYDLVVDLHDSLRSRYLCLGATRVVRINKRKLARALLIWFKWNVYERAGGVPSVAERYLETLDGWEVPNDGNGLELFITPAATENARARFREEGFTLGTPLLGVCPSARHGNKMWLKERFAEAAARLAKEHRIGVALFGGDDERERCSEIAALIRAQTPEAHVANLAGRLSLLETAAAMDSCTIVITNDSGLMHVAAARKRNIVAVFGPTVRELGFFPYGTQNVVVQTRGLNCRPCTHIGLPSCPKGHFRCMHDIAVHEVVDAASRLMTTHASS